MARGGARSGRPGAAYGNRTDLQAPKLPAVAPTGLPYGEHQQLVQAQQAVPAGPPPPPTAAGPAPGGGTTGPPPPGSFPLTRPTERPTEPVTAGMPMGAGPGPEVLGPQRQVNMSDMLRQAGSSVGSTALTRLADMAQAQGQ